METHLTPDVRQLLNSCGTEVEYIPPRYTSKLQPMDVGMNKPFKDRMRYCAEEFMITYGVNCKPVRRDVTQWIKQAWETIPNEVLVKTWRHIGYAGEKRIAEGLREDILALQEPDESDADDDDLSRTSKDF